MSTNSSIALSADVTTELNHYWRKIETVGAAEKIWKRLTDEERQGLGVNVRAATEQNGVVAMWRKLKSVSLERAIVDIAFQLNFMTPYDQQWLLQQLGECEPVATIEQRVAAEEPVAVEPPVVEKPCWNRETLELTFVGAAIRRIGRPDKAKNVMTVLDAFQDCGWPSRIDDPLPGGRNQERLHRTIASLNHGLIGIKFSGDGSGEGFAWQRI